MDFIYKESGRSARIASRFFDRIVRIELTRQTLSFHTTLLGFKCKELLAIPVEQIASVTLVSERGMPSFEVNTQGRRKMCWYDTRSAEDWERAFGLAGVIVERAPEEVPASAEIR